jgi:hypothetical protein
MSSVAEAIPPVQCFHRYTKYKKYQWYYFLRIFMWRSNRPKHTTIRDFNTCEINMSMMEKAFSSVDITIYLHLADIYILIKRWDPCQFKIRIPLNQGKCPDKSPREQ